MPYCNHCGNETNINFTDSCGKCYDEPARAEPLSPPCLIATNPKMGLTDETFKKLDEKCKWEGVSYDRYISVLMAKCPHPFGC